MLSNTLLCKYATTLTDSSVLGHLGCFHMLPVVNIVAVNIDVQVSFLISVLYPFRRFLGVKSLDPVVH